MVKDKERPPRFFRTPLFLFLILPVLLSVLLHAGFLLYARFIPLCLRQLNQPLPSKSILVDIKQKDLEPPDAAGAPRTSAVKRPEKQPLPQSKAQPVARNAQPASGGEGGHKDTLAILAGTQGADWLKVDASWGEGEGNGGMLHTGPQGPTQTFSEYLDALRTAGLDVVIVLDSTCSMDVIITQIKPKIENLALALRKLVPSCRIGVVTYRDRGDEYLAKSLPLTYGISSVKEFIRKIDAKGGGDVPEAVDEGLRVAIQEMKWNPKSKAFVLIIGDAPPHKEDVPRAVQMAAAFRKQRKGTISVLDVTTHYVQHDSDRAEEAARFVTDAELEEGHSDQSHRRTVDPDLLAIAEAGGGEAARLVDEERIVKNMLLYIVGTQWRPYLTEIMKNL